MKPLILKDVDKSFQKKKVLRQVNLEMEKGEIACLLGPSGMGKSTLLRLVAGLEKLDGGEIESFGKCLSGPSIHLPPKKRDIGFVFQNYALFPHMNVYENMDFFLEKKERNRKERILELLELFDLSSEIKKYPEQLSGGQRQRLAVARSIAQKPKLLLMDEPFANIDYKLRKRLVQETRQIIKQFGISSMIVTHDMEDAFDLADKVGILLDNTIKQWDTPYNIYHEPKTIEVAKLLGPSVFLKAEVTPKQCLNLGNHHLCGDLQKRTSKSFHTGQTIKLLVRPDDILHNDDSPIKAKVVNRFFRGAYHMYELELDEKYRFFSFVPSHHDHQIGEYIGIDFELEHLVCF